MPGDNININLSQSVFTRGRPRESAASSAFTSSSRPQRSVAPPPPTPSLFTLPSQQPCVLFPSSSTEPDDFDDDDLDFDAEDGHTDTFAHRLSAPFMSPPRPKRPALHTPSLPRLRTHSRPMPIEDADGGIFLSTPQKTPAPARPALSPVAVNSALAPTARKRKPTTPVLATPPTGVRTTTPLGTTSGASAFDRLAPLPAPRFTTRTPPRDTDAFVRAQTHTMTRLRIAERAASPGASHDEEDDAVVAAVSADGHVTKRRARTRPLSSDLRECASPSLVFPPQNSMHFPSSDTPRSPPPPGSPGSSEFGSPQPRRRMSTDRRSTSRSRAPSVNTRHRLAPAPLSRLQSTSSATMFFGPAITKPAEQDMPPLAPEPVSAPPRPQVFTRHSYTGSRNMSTWPRSTPPPPPLASSSSPRNAEDHEEDMFFAGPAVTAGESSLLGMFSEFDASPSPPRRTAMRGLPRKYRPPRDSGICLSEDEAGAHAGMPTASTSVSTVQSGFSDAHALATPLLGPGELAGWPAARVAGADDARAGVDAFIARALAAGAKDTSTAAPGAGGAERKKAPGTPVKKVRTTFVGGARPWQSAMAFGKIGLPFLGPGPGEEEEENEESAPAPPPEKKGKKKPRASMPAALLPDKKGKRRMPGLPLVGRNTPAAPREESDEEGEWSPSAAREPRYSGIGQGVKQRAKWLMRRSSSGQFNLNESGNESAGSAGTPTRVKGPGWPTANRLSTFSISPSKRLSTFSLSPSRPGFMLGHGAGRSGSVSSVAGNSPTAARGGMRPPISGPRPLRGRQSSAELFGEYVTVPSFHAPPASAAENDAPEAPRFPQPQRSPTASSTTSTVGSGAPTPPLPRVRMSSMRAEDHRLGYFERVFVEIDELGSGEFGKVKKVRRVGDADVGAYAVKVSRQFEGSRQRLRLREEVDVLRHLASRGQHPNVLAYVDSWEEEEQLFIQTELCEHGNFGRFLWEFGRAFPRLDEARVWKILADLSHGLHFIHAQGVIHLDLKPANIFITAEGRFKIGDFGMATLWPRPPGNFEREGDKLYLAAEVLQGEYGPAADVFSLGMIMLETASNIIVPDQGEPWQRLRRDDFGQVDGLEDTSGELVDLVRGMMRADPVQRLSSAHVHAHPVVARARTAMEREERVLRLRGESVFPASPLGSVQPGFLAEVLARDDEGADEFAMDLDD